MNALHISKEMNEDYVLIHESSEEFEEVENLQDLQEVQEDKEQEVDIEKVEEDEPDKIEDEAVQQEVINEKEQKIEQASLMLQELNRTGNSTKTQSSIFTSDSRSRTKPRRKSRAYVRKLESKSSTRKRYCCC
tara:strand:- start:109 stop:507 length:399 start_codon:yes stop_codon:yes gene_type:complete